MSDRHKPLVVKELLLKNPLVFMVKSSRNDTFAFEEKPALARSKLGTPAAFYGNSEKIVQYLEEKGANLNVKTKAGQTALDIASNIAPKGQDGAQPGRILERDELLLKLGATR